MGWRSDGKMLKSKEIMTEYQEYVYDCCVKAEDNNMRLGEALITYLPYSLQDKYVNTEYDCFANDLKVNDFLIELRKDMKGEVV
jgi:hypothetical protein